MVYKDQPSGCLICLGCSLLWLYNSTEMKICQHILQLFFNING
nr:MAG TPA: hypothetical protein [Caudoviricetes sp.]